MPDTPLAPVVASQAMADAPERFVPAPVRSQDFAARTDASEAADLAACRAILDEGSKSFAAAARLLPRRIRGDVAAFYAFCRISDDLVDFSDDPAAAVEELDGRLDRLYAGSPDDDPVDRAFGRVVHRHDLPRPIVDALIEGFAWDAEEREYETLHDVLGYCARVASSLGVIMTLFMGPRDAQTMARACDLGAAMQLTNICRDVAEDAGRERLYLPAALLRERGVDPKHFVANHRDYAGDRRIAEVIEVMLAEADEYYRRADAGIRMLPWDSRPAIGAASRIYADIGRVIREQGCEFSAPRAHTSKTRKLRLLLGAWLFRTPTPDPERATAPVIPACDFLVAPFR